MNKRSKSVEVNMVLNTVRTIVSIVFPLIIFPYVTRALQMENLGKITFAQSFIGYIGLIASLGFTSYATREGGRFRSDPKKMQQFADEIFTMNMITTAAAYAVLFLCIAVFPNLKNRQVLLVIMSASIMFSTIGVDWLNVIYEDYLYITIRSILIQILSFLLTIILVRKPSDFYRYAAIQVITNGIIAVMNMIHVRQYCRLHLTRHIHFRQHLKPVLVLFSNNLAVSIYLNIDNVMIGWMVGDYFGGIYSIAVKVYTVVKQLLAAIYNVTVTRLSDYFAHQQMDDFKLLLNQVINDMIITALPVSLGIFVLSEPIVEIVAGKSLPESVIPLRILAAATPIAVFGGAIAYCVNLPLHRESVNLFSTAAGAIENLVLNLFFIPVWKASGAAFTTLLAEATVFCILLYHIRDYFWLFDRKAILSNTWKCLASCSGILVFSFLGSRYLSANAALLCVFVIVFSILSYLAINLLLKNINVERPVRRILQKIRRS